MGSSRDDLEAVIKRHLVMMGDDYEVVITILVRKKSSAPEPVDPEPNRRMPTSDEWRAIEALRFSERHRPFVEFFRSRGNRPISERVLHGEFVFTAQWESIAQSINAVLCASGTTVRLRKVDRAVYTVDARYQFLK